MDPFQTTFFDLSQKTLLGLALHQILTWSCTWAEWVGAGKLAGGCGEGGLMKKVGGPLEFTKCAHAQFHLFHATVDAYAQ